MTHRALTVALYMIISLIAVVIAALLWFYGPIAGGLLRASDGEGPTAAATNGATTLAQSASTGTGGRPAGSLGPAPLPTIRPWPTMQHTPTAIPATAIPPTVVPTIAPALDPPQQVPVNGIPWESIVVMPPDVATHAREIFAAGQALGRNPNAYSKVGDSTTENPHFLARYDERPYSLGPFAHLQAVIDHFHGSHGRDSIAVRIGLHAWTANDPTWAEAGICLPNETPVQCEIRVHNPAVVFIRLGTCLLYTSPSPRD